MFTISNRSILFASCAISFLMSPFGLQAQMNTELQDTLQQTIENFAQENDMQAIASAVVFPDGSTWSGATGEYAVETQPGEFVLEPIHTDLLYDIGSNTKSMTSAIILMLEEENFLSIDDTLYTYIDHVPNVPYGITLKQMLQHRSGIASYTSHPDFGDVVNDVNSGFLHPDSVLSRFLSTPSFTAGSSFEYSNTNYLLLGKVIEVVENKSYNEVLEDRIFTPYQLDNIYLDQYDDYSPLAKIGTWFGTSNYDNTDYVGFMSAAWAAGGVVSKPDDFAFYCYQLCRGDMLSTASMDKIVSGTSTGLGEYGLGLIKSSYNGRTYYSHGGTTLQNSEMHYSTETDFSVVVMNADYGFGGETYDLQMELIDILESLIPEYLSLDEEFVSNSLSTFPNPTIDQMNIQFSDQTENTEKSIEVYNVLGKLIYSQQTGENYITLEKDQFGSGVFWLKASDSNGPIGTEKIIFN